MMKKKASATKALLVMVLTLAILITGIPLTTFASAEDITVQVSGAVYAGETLVGTVEPPQTVKVIEGERIEEDGSTTKTYVVPAPSFSIEGYSDVVWTPAQQDYIDGTTSYVFRGDTAAVEQEKFSFSYSAKMADGTQAPNGGGTVQLRPGEALPDPATLFTEAEGYTWVWQKADGSPYEGDYTMPGENLTLVAYGTPVDGGSGSGKYFENYRTGGEESTENTPMNYAPYFADLGANQVRVLYRLGEGGELLDSGVVDVGAADYTLPENFSGLANMLGADRLAVGSWSEIVAGSEGVYTISDTVDGVADGLLTQAQDTPGRVLIATVSKEYKITYMVRNEAGGYVDATFEDENQQPVVPTEFVKEGAQLAQPPVPVYTGTVAEGETFGGWTLPEYNTLVTFPLTVNGPVTLNGFFGDAPTDGMNTEVKLEHLLSLQPQLETYSHSLETSTKDAADEMPGFVSLTGSITGALDIELKNVKFVIRVTDDDPRWNGDTTKSHVVLENSTALDGSRGVVNGNIIEITVDSIKPKSGTTSSTNYGSLLFYFENNYTPNGTKATFEIMSVSCGGVTMTREDWEKQSSESSGSKHWTSGTTVSSTAIAKNQWSLKDIDISRKEMTLGDLVEGDARYGKTEYEFSQPPKFTMNAFTNTASTAYVDANGVRFIARLEGVPVKSYNPLVFDEDLLAALGADTAWFSLYNVDGLEGEALQAMRDLQALFEKSFKLEDIGSWQVEIRNNGGALEMRFTRHIEINTETTPPAANVIGTTFVTPVLTIRKAFFNEKDGLGLNEYEGKYEMTYLAGKDSDDNYLAWFSTPEMKDGTLTETVNELTTANGAATTLKVTKATSLKTVVENLIKGFGKKVDNAWLFTAEGYDANTAQLGLAGELSRQFVSNEVVDLPNSENTIVTNRYWFNWTPDAKTYNALIDKISIIETAGGAITVGATDIKEGPNKGLPENTSSGWSSNIAPKAFMAPTVGDDTKWTLTIKFSDNTTAVIEGTGADSSITSDAGSNLVVSDASGDRTVYLVAAGKTVTGFQLVYENTGDEEARKTQTIKTVLGMRVMFEHNGDVVRDFDTNVAIPLEKPKDMYNNSRIEAVYRQADDKGVVKDVTYAVERASTVPYKEVQEDYGRNKTAKNVTHSGEGNRPGDVVEYTITFDFVNVSNDLGFVKNLWIRDLADKNVDFSAEGLPQSIISITRESSNTDITLLGQGKATTYNIDMADYATGSATTLGSGEAGEEWTAGLDAQEFIFKFDGTLMKGDSITITYYGKISGTVADNAKIYNEFYYYVWPENTESPGHGGTIPGDDIKWVKGGDYTIHIVSTLHFGDVMLTFVPQVYTGEPGSGSWPNAVYNVHDHYYYWQGNDVAAIVTGGLVRAEADLYAPQFIFHLPENTNLNPLAGDVAPDGTELYEGLVYGVQYLQFSNLGTHNSNAATNDRTLTEAAGDLGAPVVETFENANGTFVIVTFPDAVLRHEYIDEDETQYYNEVISFRVSLQANDVASNPAGKSTNGGVLLTGKDKDGDRVSLYQNSLLQDSGNWPDRYSRNSNNGSDGSSYPVFTGVGYLGEDEKVLRALADEEAIVTLSPLTKLALTKTGDVKEIKEDESITYTVNVTRSMIAASGQSPDAFKNNPYRAYIPDYLLYQVVDILPPGQFVETENEDGTGTVKASQVELKFNNDESDPDVKSLDDYEITYTADLVSYEGHTVQRIIVSIEGGLEMKYGASSNQLTLTYTAVQKNIDIIKKAADRPESVKVDNDVSIFYYAPDAAVTAPYTATYEKDGEDGLLAAWWEEYDFGTGTSNFGKDGAAPLQLSMADYTRAQASWPLEIVEDRIGPGITKAHKGSREYYVQEGQTHVGVNWEITVHNQNKAGKDMTDYYVVDVLPYGTEFFGMLAGDVGNPKIYYNTGMQQVLVWHSSDGIGTVASGFSKTFTIITKTPDSAFDRQLNTAYVIPQDGYFTGADIAKSGSNTLGIYKEGTKDLYLLEMHKDSAAEVSSDLSKLVANLRYQKAVEASDWIIILNQFRASAYKWVTNDPEPGAGDTTTSATPYDTIPVVRGGKAYFGYEIQNNSTAGEEKRPYTSLEFYDVVAGLDDLYTNQNRPRESGWDLNMVLDSIQVVRHGVDENGKETQKTLKQTTGTEEGDYEVSFTKDVPGLYYEGMTDHKTWVKSWDWTGGKVKAFSVVLDDKITLSPSERLEITWTMDVPTSISAAAYTAKSFNSGMFYFEREVDGDTDPRSYSGEPEKVGLHLANLEEIETEITIMKDLTDNTLAADETDRIYFRLYQVNQFGRNEPFDLYNSGADVADELVQEEAADDPNNPEYFGLFHIELGDGEVKGGTITGLPPGRYYVEEQLTEEQAAKYTFATSGHWFNLLPETEVVDNHNGSTVTFYNTTFVPTEEPLELSLEVWKYLSDTTVADTVTRTFEYELQRFEDGAWQPFSLDTEGLSFTEVNGFTKLDATGRFTIEATSDGGAYGMKILGMPEGSYRFEEIDSLGYEMWYYTQQGTLTPVNQSLIFNMLNYLGNPPILLTPPTPPTPLGAPLRFGGVDMIDPWNPELPTMPGQAEGEITPPITDPGEGAHWSLLNLMCALFCGITSLIMLIMMIARKLKRKTDEDEQAEAMELGQEYDEERAEKRKGGFIWRVAAGVVAVGAIIAFLLTEDIRNPMIWACEWTPMMVIFAIAQVLVMLGLRNTLRQADPEEWEDIDLDPQGGAA